MGSGHSGLLTRRRLVDEEVDAQFEERSLEISRQRWKLANAGDAAPGGAVDGGVLAGTIQVHRGDAAVGKNGETDQRLTLFVEGWSRLLRNQRNPGPLDVGENASEVRAEVDAH